MRREVWERWTTLAVCLGVVSLLLVACHLSSQAPRSADEVAEQDGRLARESMEPAANEPVEAVEAVEAHEPERQKHIVYLHGRIVAEQGPTAVSDEYGPYQFYEIVEKLGSYHAVVHAPLRDNSEQLDQSVSVTVELVRKLLAEGVEPAEITVIGASQGALIAMRASEQLQTGGLRFVLMGACNDWVRDEVAPRLVGDVLSIYEEGDRYGGSCQDIIAASPGVDYAAEVRLETGLGHGFLYRPIPEWVEPVRGWVKDREGGSSRTQR